MTLTAGLKPKVGFCSDLRTIVFTANSVYIRIGGLLYEDQKCRVGVPLFRSTPNSELLSVDDFFGEICQGPPRDVTLGLRQSNDRTTLKVLLV